MKFSATLMKHFLKHLQGCICANIPGLNAGAFENKLHFCTLIHILFYKSNIYEK